MADSRSLRALDAWLRERQLVLALGEPFYRVELHGPRGRFAEGDGLTVEQAVEASLADADVRQVQADERWMVQNPPPMTLAQVDERLAELGRLLVIRPWPVEDAPPEYQAFTIEWESGATSRSVTAPALADLLAELLLRPAADLGPPRPPPHVFEAFGPPLQRATEERAVDELRARTERDPETLQRLVASLGVTGAAAELGLPRSTLRSRLAGGGARAPLPSKTRMREVLAGSSTVKEAEKQLGMRRGTLHRHLPEAASFRPSKRPFDAKAGLVARLLEKHDGSIAEAAEAAGVAHGTFRKWLHEEWCATGLHPMRWKGTLLQRHYEGDLVRAAQDARVTVEQMKDWVGLNEPRCASS